MLCVVAAGAGGELQGADGSGAVEDRHELLKGEPAGCPEGVAIEHVAELGLRGVFERSIRQAVVAAAHQLVVIAWSRKYPAVSPPFPFAGGASCFAVLTPRGSCSWAFERGISCTNPYSRSQLLRRSSSAVFHLHRPRRRLRCRVRRLLFECPVPGPMLT